jgi:hypothetical protein
MLWWFANFSMFFLVFDVVIFVVVTFSRLYISIGQFLKKVVSYRYIVNNIFNLKIKKVIYMKQKFTELNYRGTYWKSYFDCDCNIRFKCNFFLNCSFSNKKNYIDQNAKKIFLILRSFIGMIVKLKFYCFSCCKIAIYWSMRLAFMWLLCYEEVLICNDS